MRTSDFAYELPEALIAQHPLEDRTASRLLVVDAVNDERLDRQFSQLTDFLRSGDLLVFNNTRVIPARLHGRKSSGGKVEVLLERLLDEHSALCQVRASKALKAGGEIILAEGVSFVCMRRQDGFFILRSTVAMLDIFNALGQMPLPPYIDRAPETADQDRYQTVYAKQVGAVAAPTAGLHFDENMLSKLDSLGVEKTFVTLHVGRGYFSTRAGWQSG